MPDTWFSITLTEGKNRQTRRTTAAAGHPTLRLVRIAIGNLETAPLKKGEWLQATAERRVGLGLRV